MRCADCNDLCRLRRLRRKILRLYNDGEKCVKLLIIMYYVSSIMLIE